MAMNTRPKRMFTKGKDEVQKMIDEAWRKSTNAKALKKI